MGPAPDFGAGLGVGYLLFGGPATEGPGNGTGPARTGGERNSSGGPEGYQGGDGAGRPNTPDAPGGYQPDEGQPPTPGGGPGFPVSSSQPPTDGPEMLSPEALEAGERLTATLREGGGGGGRVTELVDRYPDDPEAQAAFERERMATWTNRLEREIDIKVRGLRESVGLSSTQETALRQILEAELAERQKLVQAFSQKTITGPDFDAAVQANVADARQKLAQLLTPAQMETYHTLKPREQVLRLDVK